ncbi:hypothetical protein [Mycolicibacterium holsaticum]|uniref:hypothetical protein n=1 Tax=Mycolicibacterium holsaticum TaxID=152142 RepID=UPI001C7D9A32|nr:hypothetical protein [Mycolicibacterium holsaticum]MDA4110184.1 hypothetical protein [Mycolicibacterium holsaticum DSM 44478 = JCM 12374]QZA11912.1 hypothetical protein K3U96_22565 [Mycolicibacterium holsaticum DSM 44478 = JCM 12374]UNC10600.1 hypothetical protein H5U41_04250 [Mycolicibacterium holsaticum DSM 44478 = JCM 12374]
MNHPSAGGHPADDDPDEALVQRVAARMRAAGRHVVTDADPDEVRWFFRSDQAATLALSFGLVGHERGFAAAVDYASRPRRCGHDDTGWALLPGSIWLAAAYRLPVDRLRVLTAEESLADPLPRPVAVDRARVELAAWRVINRLRDHLTDAEVAALRLRCAGGDNDTELRMQRAAAMMALGQITGDDEMRSTATELALRECYERPGLIPSVVFSTVAPLVASVTAEDGTVDPHHLAATLRAELVRVDTLMVFPDADVGGVA